MVAWMLLSLHECSLRLRTSLAGVWSILTNSLLCRSGVELNCTAYGLGLLNAVGSSVNPSARESRGKRATAALLFARDLNSQPFISSNSPMHIIRR